VRTTRLVAAAVIGLVLATAACGAGSPKVASLGTTTTAVPTGEAATGGPASGAALVLYAGCMRSHGVSSFPEPASLGSSAAIRAFKTQINESVASSSTFEAAQRACA
jgi:hypothetical protein